jgi:hypothetical protein
MVLTRTFPLVGGHNICEISGAVEAYIEVDTNSIESQQNHFENSAKHVFSASSFPASFSLLLFTKRNLLQSNRYFC